MGVCCSNAGGPSMYVARDCLKGKRDGAELSKKVVAVGARLLDVGVCIEEGRESRCNRCLSFHVRGLVKG